MYGLLRDVERPDLTRTRSLLFYVGAALGVLAKGFLGLIFPLLIFGVALAVARGLTWRELNFAPGAALFLLIAAPCHLLAAWRSPTLSEFYVRHNHLLRSLNARRLVEDDVPISKLGSVLGDV